MQLFHASLTLIGLAGLFVAAAYAFVSVAAVLAWRWSRRTRRSAALPPVTVLKPLCGAEPRLYDDLRSFCMQDYPRFQVLFGIRDPADPARPIAERLKAEFPQLDIEVVVNPQLHGQNCKISNLINMLPLAKHDLLAMADSDGVVDSDYLAVVTAPLADPEVGLVTCIYHGVPTAGIWSRLGAMYINEWYMPSVLLARLFGHQGYVSGQTVCLTRETLKSIGGFERIANHLADDYCLGQLVRESGRRVVLSPYVVTGMHDEPSLEAIERHEIRWMRTLSVLRPRSFRFLFMSFSLPLGVAGFFAAGGALPSATFSLMSVVLVSRLVVHFVHRVGSRHGRSLTADLWLLPLRDVLLCWVWMRSFFTTQVLWRGAEFDVARDGIMRRL